jgi:hypothetical protein
VRFKGDSSLEERKLRTLESAFTFGEQHDRENISQTLSQCFDDIQVRFPEFPETDETQAPRKRRKEPPFIIWDSATRVFSACCQCHDTICAKHSNHEARLMLATYSNMRDFDDDYFLDLLMSFDDERCLWEELRVHTLREE